MRIIETNRLILNNFQLSDLDDLFELVTDYCSTEYSKYDQKWPNTKDGIKKVIEWFSSNDVYLAVRTKHDNKVIGFINLSKEDIEVPVTYNIGYIFNSKYHKQGFAFEACKAYLEYGKNEFGLVEVITGTAKENRSSCKLLEKLGFKLIKKEKVHLQIDENAKPIEFIGCNYKIRL
jgi:[ribosomal protein S5]-alanine N-acetyltransferase